MHLRLKRLLWPKLLRRLPSMPQPRPQTRPAAADAAAMEAVARAEHAAKEAFQLSEDERIGRMLSAKAQVDQPETLHEQSEDVLAEAQVSDTHSDHDE